MAEATGLDGLVLNLGKENWQLEQAKVAYNLATKRIWENKRNRPLQLFLSLDMNVLPAVTEQDATTLADKIGPLLLSPAQMLRNGRPIISTFGGQRSFGGHGWKPFMDRVHSKLENKKVFFWPAFFAPPDQLAEKEMLDGLFAWNSAW